jgi:ribosomal protein S18 acetylase RimI-like enzyme
MGNATPAWVLSPVSASDARRVADVARLHRQLLDFGPMARLGERFLRDFCYTVLVRQGLMDVTLCEVNGQPAGFVAFTAKSITFHREAMARNFMQVAWLGLISVAHETRPLSRLRDAVLLMRSRRLEAQEARDPLAELIAIAVLPEFTRPEFMRATGLRVSELLLLHCAERFRAQGLDRMRMVVDRSNPAALLFYQALGAQLEPYERGGRPSFQVWLDLADLPGPQEAFGASAPAVRPTVARY